MDEEEGSELVHNLNVLSNSQAILLSLFGVGWILLSLKQLRDFYFWYGDPLSINNDNIQPDTAITDDSQNINPTSKRRSLRNKVVPEQYEQINSINVSESKPRPRRLFKFREMQKK